MHAAIAHQAHQVKGFARHFCLRESGLQHRIFLQFLIANRDINPLQFLIHNAAGTEVEVAYFAVAHLPGGQTYVFAASYEGAVRIFLVEAVNEGRVCGGYSIGAGHFPQSPAVHDEEDCFVHGGKGRGRDGAWRN